MNTSSEKLIYMLTFPNKKIYIGKTTRGLKQRWAWHVSDAKKNRNQPVCRAIRFYGPENVDKRVLETLKTNSDIDAAEKKYVNKYKSNKKNIGYNLTEGGDGGRWSKDAKKNVSGKNHHAYGKKRKPSTRKKLSSALMGNKNALGFNHTEKTKQSLRKPKSQSQINKQIARHKEARQKGCVGSYGLYKGHTPLQKLKQLKEAGLSHWDEYLICFDTNRTQVT